MQLTALLVPTYTQMLKTLSGWLKKAQAQLPESEAQALLSVRLAPDMFPLSTQVRFACVQAGEAVDRPRGQAFPAGINERRDEWRQAGGRPGPLAAAYCRIDETVAVLDGLAAGALDAKSDKRIAHELANRMICDLTAEQ